MTRRYPFLPGQIAFASILSLAVTANSLADTTVTAPGNPQLAVPTPLLRRHANGKDHSVPKKRGVAILPPAESPDSWDPAVGGKTVYTPYYPDYCPHRHHGPRIFVPNNGIGYVGRHLGTGVPGPYSPDPNFEATGVPGYGNFSGARQDEKNLSRLGGFSSADSAAEPTSITPDLIDELEGRR